MCLLGTVNETPSEVTMHLASLSVWIASRLPRLYFAAIPFVKMPLISKFVKIPMRIPWSALRSITGLPTSVLKGWTVTSWDALWFSIVSRPLRLITFTVTSSCKGGCVLFAACETVQAAAVAPLPRGTARRNWSPLASSVLMPSCRSHEAPTGAVEDGMVQTFGVLSCSSGTHAGSLLEEAMGGGVAARPTVFGWLHTMTGGWLGLMYVESALTLMRA